MGVRITYTTVVLSASPVSLWGSLPDEIKADLESCMKKSESFKLGRKLGEGMICVI